MKKSIPDEDYKKILEHIPICCVDLIIREGNKILLILRKDNPARGLWWFPGGRLIKGEKLENAAIRKAFQEVGLKIKIIKQIGAYQTIFDDGPFPEMNGGVHSVNICFLAELSKPNQKINLDNTSMEFKWFDKIEPCFPKYVEDVLRDTKIF